jgi:uncharacterized protein involved in exopolysaccharide biosynthesis
MEQTVDLAVLWSRLWEYRRPIAIFVAIATVITGIVAFALPPTFLATASLLPPAEEDTGFGVSRLLRGVALPGVKLPSSATPSDVFMAALESRRIREEVVNRFGLMKIYKRKFMEDAVKDLRRNTKFKVTDVGVIEMQLEDRNPKRAAAMLQAYIDLLDQFNREVRSTKGRRTRIFVEERLTENKTELAKSEQALANYQASHKAAIITPEMSTAAEASARIYSQRMALQVRLGVVRGYTHGERSPEEQQILDQMAQLDAQLRTLPETGLELARLLREVKKYEQIYALLTAQYEEARIDEARDVVTVDVLDAPTPPERKAKPHRLLLTLIGFLLSLGAGIAYAMFQGEKQPRSVAAAAASAAR